MPTEPNYFGVQLGQAIAGGMGNISQALQRKYEMQQREQRMNQMLQAQRGNMLAREGYEMSPAGFEQFMAQKKAERGLTERRSTAQTKLAELQSKMYESMAGAGAEMAQPNIVTDPQGREWVMKMGIRGPEFTEVSPTLRAKDIEAKEAKENVTKTLSEVKGLYSQLQKSGGIVDIGKGALLNIGAGIASTQMGQAAAGFVGGEDQSIRNTINSARPLLVNFIRQASKMGARGLDSEKELEFYLQAATDPARDVQANYAAIVRLDKAYGSGTLTADPKAMDALKKEFGQSIDKGAAPLAQNEIIGTTKDGKEAIFDVNTKQFIRWK